jgi:hypothetical protein
VCVYIHICIYIYIYIYIYTYLKNFIKNNKEEMDIVAYTIIPATWEEDIRGSRFEASLGKRLARRHLKEQTWHCGICT